MIERGDLFDVAERTNELLGLILEELRAQRGFAAGASSPARIDAGRGPVEIDGPGADVVEDVTGKIKMNLWQLSRKQWSVSHVEMVPGIAPPRFILHFKCDDDHMGIVITERDANRLQSQLRNCR